MTKGKVYKGVFPKYLTLFTYSSPLFQIFFYISRKYRNNNAFIC
jgi:hypothetical protein